MGIKEYKLNKTHVDKLEEIVKTADQWFDKLEKITEYNIFYNDELYHVYNNYLTSLNEHMSTFLDVLKNSYDRLDMFKKIFEKQEMLFDKINIVTSNLESVFETYEYMLSKIKLLQEEFFEEYVNYKTRHFYVEYDEDRMKEKFNYVCPLHFELIEKMNEFATEVAEPQIAIADAIFFNEMDFNKALGLTDFCEK